MRNLHLQLMASAFDARAYDRLPSRSRRCLPKGVPAPPSGAGRAPLQDLERVEFEELPGRRVWPEPREPFHQHEGLRQHFKIWHPLQLGKNGAPSTSAKRFVNSRVIARSLASFSSSLPRCGTPSSSLRIVRSGSLRPETLGRGRVRIPAG
jgi:hypothetical protein